MKGLKDLRTLQGQLQIKFEKYSGQYRADAQILPGSPPVGRGTTKTDACWALICQLIYDWETWGPHILNAAHRAIEETMKKGVK